MIVANFASPADPALVLSALPTRWRLDTSVILPEDTPRWWRPPRRPSCSGETLRTTLPHDGGRDRLRDLLDRRPPRALLPGGRAIAGRVPGPVPGGDRRGSRSIAQVPVLPVGLRGSYAAVPEEARWPVRGRPRVSVRLGTPSAAGGRRIGGRAARAGCTTRCAA